MDFTKKKITRKSADYQEIAQFIERIFPEEQRIPLFLIEYLTFWRKNTFTAYYEGDLFVGLFFNMKFPHTTYVFYFAVNESLQNQGYGSRLLAQLFRENPGKSYSLLIETLDQTAENYEQRVKRLAFYEKNGFHQTGIQVGRNKPIADFLSTKPDFSLKDGKRIMNATPLNVFLKEEST